MISFRHNGYLYNQSYALIPTQMTSGTWVWLCPYYSREVRGQGWISMSPFEFLLDSTKEEK
jgi:hypothetical protein